MEDLPTLEHLNLTKVQFTEAVNYLKRFETVSPAFISSIRIDIDNLDKDELTEIAKEHDLPIWQLDPVIQVVYEIGKANLVMTSKL